MQGYKISAALKFFMFKAVRLFPQNLNLELFLSMKKKALFNVLKKPEAENSEAVSA